MRTRSYREVRWPFNGLHVGKSFHGQAPDTTVACQNVRNFDPRTGRSRGAQRSGLTRYLDAQAAGTGNVQIQDITSIVTVPTSSTTLTDLVARTTTNVSVCDGNVQTFDTTAFTTATNGTAALSSTAAVIFSAQLFGTLYFADGASQKSLTGTTVSSWSAGAGSFPANGAHRPRLIEQWRTRIVMSGLRGDAHNWFMSAAGDATDFDYAVTPIVPTMAVAGNSADAGYVGDVVNSIVPYDDDTLIFGCDHSIWQMSGDPADGGVLDEISDITGMAFGRPWCKSYDGSIFFMGSRGGIYRMGAGQKPERISSDRIEESLQTVDLNTTIVRCVYDDRTQGIHFFLTPLTAGATTHYFYDLRLNAFWADKFESALFNPVAVYLLDGDDPDDRVVLLGGFDRRIRKIDYTAKSDDTEAINSYVWIGPLKVDEGQKVQLKELLGTLDDDSEGAYYEVYGAQGAQMAYSRGQKFYSGIWGPGKNWADARRASGSAIYIKIGNSDMASAFAYETIFAALQGSGISATRAAR